MQSLSSEHGYRASRKVRGHSWSVGRADLSPARTLIFHNNSAHTLLFLNDTKGTISFPCPMAIFRGSCAQDDGPFVCIQPRAELPSWPSSACIRCCYQHHLLLPRMVPSEQSRCLLKRTGKLMTNANLPENRHQRLPL